MQKAKKWLGQHFLVDDTVINRIVEVLHSQPADSVLEIGPGRGALTKVLSARLNHLFAIEIDADMISTLQRTLAATRLTLYHQDVLTFQLPELPIGKQWRLVGNLPYNISTPLLFHWLTQLPQIKDMHFMVQKEVADRLCAQPGTRAYGRLTIMVRYFCDVFSLFDIPPEAFSPPPKVMSSVIRIVPKMAIPYPVKDFSLLQAVVTAAFSQRRKKIRSSLQAVISENQLQKLGIDVNLRAESLSIDAFVAIANFVQEQGHASL